MGWLLSRAVPNTCRIAHYDANGAGAIHTIRIAEVGLKIKEAFDYDKITALAAAQKTIRGGRDPLLS